MKTKIAILGSCISRDVFNSYFVPNYKEFFEVALDVQRTTLISLMQDPVLFDKNSLDILPQTPKNNTSTKFMTYDLNKFFLKNIIGTNVDYLIIDNFFEYKMGILYFDENIITDNIWDLPETQFYKNISDKFSLKLYENFDEYFCIWSRYCDLFFKFLNLCCPDVKVILNQARLTDKVIKSDGTTYINSEFTETVNIANPLLDKLDSYICDNFDVKVLKFDYDNTYCDENHVWGFAPMHFNKNFHSSLFNNLGNIVSKDKMQKSLNNPKNHIFDENSFERELHRTNFETQMLLKNIKKNNISELLKIYNRARIDVKNYGLKDNKIRLLEEKLPLSEIYYPEWFRSNDGEGMFISSENGSLDFRLECINDGFLRIYLRGSDILDKNFVRFPVYIDFVKFKVNNELIFNESKLVWHDEPYVFEKEVKNSEIIDIHVEWLPFNKSSIFKRKYQS